MIPTEDGPKERVSRRTALKTGLLASSTAVIGLPVISGRVAAATVTVDQNDASNYDTVQAGVNAADAGDTVVVESGTYREQVLVNEDLTLQGNGATIEAEDSPNTFELVESGSTWAPMVFAYGGSLSGGTVSGTDTVDVDVTGFELDGRGDTGQSGRKTGLLYRNVRGSTTPSRVTGNSVQDLGTPGGSIGIVAYGDSDVVVRDNSVTGFGRGGVGANGDGGAHPSPNVTIRDNQIDSGSEAGGSAPNGVQVGFGASGEVMGNVISNCRYATGIEGLFQASGVLVFESDEVEVKKNVLEDNDVAVAASAWGWFLDSANDVKVVQNEIGDALIGVNLRATAWDQNGGLASFTNEGPSVDDCKVVNNEIVDSSGDSTGLAGIAVETNDRGESDAYEPSAENNKLIRNTVEGFVDQITDDGTDTEIHAIEP